MDYLDLLASLSGCSYVYFDEDLSLLFGYRGATVNVYSVHGQDWTNTDCFTMEHDMSKDRVQDRIEAYIANL